MEKDEIKTHLKILKDYLEKIEYAEDGSVYKLINSKIGYWNYEKDVVRSKDVLENTISFAKEYIKMHNLLSLAMDLNLSGYYQEDTLGKGFVKTLALLIEKLKALLKNK